MITVATFILHSVGGASQSSWVRKRNTMHPKGKITEKSPKPRKGKKNDQTTQSQAFGCVQILLPGFPGGSVGKESAYNAGDPSSIPRLGRSPGERKGYPLQYSGLENSTDCIVHGVTKSQT